jgi:hypothetical protein
MPRLDSTVKVEQSGLGTDVDLVDDLGFDETEPYWEGRLQIKFAQRHKFNFAYLPFKEDADKVITTTIEFAGQTYPVGTRVESKVDLKALKVGYEYDFLSGESGFLGAMLDVLLADASVELKAPALGIEEKEEFTGPIPLLGLVGRVYPVQWVNVTGRVSGVSLGSYGYAVDAEGSVNVNPVKYLGISAGYRYLRTKADYNDDSLDLTLAGPFIALNLRF